MKKFLCLLFIFLSITLWSSSTFIPFIQKSTIEGKPAIVMHLIYSTGYQTFETVESRDKLFSILEEIGGGAK